LAGPSGLTPLDLLRMIVRRSALCIAAVETEDGHTTLVNMMPQNPAPYSVPDMPDGRAPGRSSLLKPLGGAGNAQSGGMPQGTLCTFSGKTCIFCSRLPLLQGQQYCAVAEGSHKLPCLALTALPLVERPTRSREWAWSLLESSPEA
jgi:hypothetical protein